MNVLTKLVDPRCAPVRAHATDAGADLISTSNHILWPEDHILIDTGVAVQIPKHFVGLVFSRSGQGKIGVSLANSVGVIDSDYRGNIKVMLRNDGDRPYDIIAFQTKIAQLVITPVALAFFMEYTGDNWEDTERASNGFGSTG